VPDLDDAYVTGHASIILHTLEQAIDELIKVLEPTGKQKEELVHVYLLGPIIVPTESTTHIEATENDCLSMVQDIRADAIVHVLRPDDHAEQLLFPLIQTLVARWMGQNAESATFFLHGLAGRIAAHIDNGPGIEQTETQIRRALESGHSISIFATTATTKAEEGLQEVAHNDIATSFVTFLIENYGNKALRDFFAIYDVERQDQAALSAYHRPLGQLEELWLAKLQKSKASAHALVTFVRRMIPLLKPYWIRECEVLFYSILGLAYNVIVPLSGKYLLDTIIPQKNLVLLLIFIVVMFSFFLLNAVLGLRRTQVNAQVVQQVGVDLQQQSFNRLQRLSHEFYGQAKVGDLMSRLSTDLQILQEALSQVLGNGIFMICNMIIAIIVLLSLAPIIGGSIIIVIPLLALAYSLLGKKFEKASIEKQKLVGEVAAATQENISAHAVIKAFGLEQNTINVYRSRLLMQLKASVHLTFLASLFESSLTFASMVGQLAVLGIGGYLAIQGHLTAGTLLAALSVLPSVFYPVAMLGSILETIQTASGSMERIIELQDEPVTIADKADAVTLPLVTQEICLEKVSFGYESNRTILDTLDLSIPIGTNVAIVGPSGSGKSSVINLLLRFWDPGRGCVRFDGYDIRDVTLASLRGQVGIVFQDTFVFDTTIRENIAIGRPGATDSEIAEAAKGARLDEYIRLLPAGYNTVLGERGVRMSGGQRQRLAIARALLRNPRVLILDEATSALDTQTEREILETLDELKRGRTTISITHRLSVAALADHILVLEHGKLVEQGSHSELLERDGLYRRLYQEQTGRVATHNRPFLGINPEQLRRIPLFKDFSTEFLEKVTPQLTRKRFEMGEYVVSQGEAGDTFYIVNYGQVEVLLNDGSTKRRINILDEGDFFGEMSLLINEPRSASVRTTLPTECYMLTKVDFTTLVSQEPQLEKAVKEAVNQRRAELATLYTFMRQPMSMVNLLPVATLPLHVRVNSGLDVQKPELLLEK